MALQMAVVPPLILLLRQRADRFRLVKERTWLSRQRERSLAGVFHGHLGPWLALGMKMGRHALELLRHEGYFGLRVTAEVPDAPPPSCLVDGLQISTGCTYGKRNIEIVPAEQVKVTFADDNSSQALALTLTAFAISLTEDVEKHDLARRFRQVLKAAPEVLFEVSEIRR